MMRLSPSALNLLNDCPLCFWMDKVKGIKRPRGIFPSLPSGMDFIIKKDFDKYREVGVLPVVMDIPGIRLVEIKLIKAWRHWRSGLSWNIPGTDYLLGGALDEAVCSLNTPVIYSPVDYKTRGSAVPDWQAYVKKYYQAQISTYDLLLQKNGYQTSGKGYFVYFYPEHVEVSTGKCKFKTVLVEIETHPDDALALAEKAMEIIAGPMPEPDPGCDYCTRDIELRNFLEGATKGK